MEVWVYTILSVVAVSLVALSGIFLLTINRRYQDSVVFALVSFAVGSMIGNVLFELLPESYEAIGDFVTIGWLVVLGLVIFFIIENVHMFHKHHLPKKKSLKSLGYMNLLADGIHNFTDGILIAVSWMISYEVGLSTTIAIFIHELPQELSDYGILIKAGFSKSKALLYNLLSAASAILGAVLALLVGQSIEGFAVYLLPVAAGCFIYLSLFSLLPLIVKGNSLRKTLMQILIIVAGVVLMYLVAE